MLLLDGDSNLVEIGMKKQTIDYIKKNATTKRNVEICRM